jgi:hypothetical protein
MAILVRGVAKQRASSEHQLTHLAGLIASVICRPP